jgi:hypothetical protein
MKKLLIGIVLSAVLMNANEDGYTLGQGLKSDKFPISLGGYITGFYSSRVDGQSVVSLDDVAVMGYGELAPNLTTMVEFESAGFYEKTFQNGTVNDQYNGKLRVERAYLNYAFSDALGLRMGKFITPAGIWNQTPVPVFKDTFSKPRLSLEIFPRFSTGAMVHGSSSLGENELWYSVFAQLTPDLDPAYNNIESTNSLGGSLTLIRDKWSGGVAFGQFKNVRSHDLSEYIGIYQSYATGALKLTAEAFVSYDEYDVVAGSNDRKYKKSSYYIQGVYKLLPKLSGVWRNEYFANEYVNDKETINTIGLNYKPHSAVSFKIERQFSNKKGSDITLTSFSILF